MCPNADFFGRPGTWRERSNREAGCAIQKEDDFVLLNCQGFLGLLAWMSRMGAWTGGPEPIIQGSHLASSLHGDKDSVTCSNCPYIEAGSWRGTGLSPGLPPSWTLSFEVFLPSTMVASPDIRSPWEENSLRAPTKSWCVLSFSFLLVRSQLCIQK
jgi:hypothetical protein